MSRPWNLFNGGKRMQRIAVYPGSFDPITNGHVDIIERAIKLFDHLIIAVSYNEKKKQTLLTESERIELIQKIFTNENKISVSLSKQLSVIFAKNHHSTTLIRGLRVGSDFDHEMQLANMNKNLEPTIETIFLMANPQFAFISSTLVREVINVQGEISPFVPSEVIEYLKIRSNSGLKK